MLTDISFNAGAPSSTSTRSESAIPYRNIDWALLLFTILLTAAGLTALASQQRAIGRDPANLLNRQGIAIALGGLGMFIVMTLDYRRLREIAHLLYLGSCGMLVLVLVAGQEVNGAKAWFDLGPLQLQPSELAKVTLVFMLAAYAADDRGEKLPFDRFVKSLFIMAIPMGLVLLQPDLGTASTMVAITMGVLLLARAPVRHIALITLMSVVTAVALVQSGYLAKYQSKRIEALVKVNKEPNKCDNDDFRQVCYARQAVTLGDLTGAGYGKGYITKAGLVAEQRTDFIFSAIAEQFGLIGGGLLLLLYLVMMLRCIRIAQLAPDHMGTLVAVGAAGLLAWHVFENVGMNIGIMPVTGIPLPLVSYGGSSAIAFLILLGLVQSVHMRRYVRS
jgi:rod shape determining protein RodA